MIKTAFGTDPLNFCTNSKKTCCSSHEFKIESNKQPPVALQQCDITNKSTSHNRSTSMSIIDFPFSVFCIKIPSQKRSSRLNFPVLCPTAFEEINFVWVWMKAGEMRGLRLITLPPSGFLSSFPGKSKIFCLAA